MTFLAEAKLAQLPALAQRSAIACLPEPVRRRSTLSIVQKATSFVQLNDKKPARPMQQMR